MKTIPSRMTHACDIEEVVFFFTALQAKIIEGNIRFVFPPPPKSLEIPGSNPTPGP